MDDTIDKLLLYMKDLPRSIENSDEVFKFLLGRINSLGKLAPPDIASLCSVVGGLALSNHQIETLAMGIVECAKKKSETSANARLDERPQFLYTTNLEASNGPSSARYGTLCATLEFRRTYLS